MRTLEEAIKHAEYIVNNRKDAISVCWSMKDCKQLAAWLRELQERRAEPEITTGEWELNQEGTTKDATSDLIEEIRCAMCRNQMKTDRGCDGNCRVDENLYKAIIQILEKHLPSAQPEQHYDEWCTGCKEYDQKRHNCPRWNKVIRQTLKDIEPKEGHWIPHETPDGGEQYECSRCGVLWEFNDGTPEENEAYFCPKCGAKMKGANGI